MVYRGKFGVGCLGDSGPRPHSERVRESWAASVTENDTGSGRSSLRSITAGLTITCAGGGLVGGVAEVHRVVGWSEP